MIQPHRENILIHKAIKDKKTSYGNHMYQHNGIIQGFATSSRGGIELLDLPVCEHCERPGAWHDQPSPGSCHCWACGKDTPNAITLREYLMNYLNISKAEMDLIETEIYQGGITQ